MAEKIVSSSNIRELPIENVMGDRFGRYSKSIIQERALPDIRDGLKPVQRRILYAMHVDNNTYDKGFKKSAKSVGNVMGNFHPHGDSSIYDAMVRLSQDWKLREPLIEMHGNNGSMDGDPPAAMRYTEARLSKISNEMLKDIDKDTVNMMLNFDDTQNEPTVLPAGFPNLLVNGATGISAGYATEIPPHNLSEVIDGTVALIDDSETSLDDLIKIIPGPDFPGGGIIQGKDGIKSAYETGRGKIVVRSKTAIQPLKGHKSQIVVTEIPYEVNKASLVKKIDELRVMKKIDGIAEVRDESDRQGLSIVVELKRDANSESILNYLYKNTDLQISYNFNMVAISEKNSELKPQQVGLIQILTEYIKHRKEVVTRRTQYDLDRANKRLHIVDGLIKALSILDDVIKTIRASENKSDARNNLVKAYEFTEAQAEAIVSLQLYRLTNTDITQLKNEKKDLNQKVDEYNNILNNEAVLMKVIKEELLEVKEKFGNARRTKIEDEIEEITIDKTDIIAKENIRVLISHDGYIKRSSIRSYQASGVEDNGLKDDDYPIYDEEISTLDHLYIFTNKGNLIYRQAYDIADSKWKDTGSHVSQELNFEKEEKIIQVFKFTDLKAKGNFIVGTNDGYVKQVEFANLLPGRTAKSRMIKAMKLHDDDSMVVHYYYSETNDNMLIYSFTHNSYALSFDLSEVPAVGAKAAGVKFMSLKDEDYIIDYFVVNVLSDTDVAIATQRGAYKQMKLSEIPVTSRARRGVVTLRELKSNPHRITAVNVYDNPETEFTLITDQNKEIQIITAQYPLSDRYSNGTFIVDSETDGVPNMLVRRPIEITENLDE